MVANHMGNSAPLHTHKVGKGDLIQHAKSE